MYLVYMDDSSEDGVFQIIGSIILKDERFPMLEDAFAVAIETMVPEDLQDDFEFHASKLYQAKEPFGKVTPEQALELFTLCAEAINTFEIPIVYGAVEVRKLRSSLYATTQPADAAFRICVQGIEKWFKEKDKYELGIMIADDSSNKHIKDNFKKSFRAYRHKVRASGDFTRGRLEHLVDDMYFGDSASSVGIQLADVVSYIILRHLKGEKDTEHLYETIRPHIFSSRVVSGDD